MKASKFQTSRRRSFSSGAPTAYRLRRSAARPDISQATYFNWKTKYDGLLPTEMRRLKQLEDENVKLTKLVADLSLDKEMLQDVIRRKLRSWPEAQAGRRSPQRVAGLDPQGLRSLEFERSTYHYKSRRSG